MRALVCKAYGTPEDLVIETVDDAVAGEDDVLIDVVAAGVNFPDLLTIAGKYQVKTPPPFIPGNEAAGIVAAVGERVTRFKPGDRVAGYRIGGAFAEKFAARQNNVVRLPDALSLEQGAGFTVTFGTSYHALRQSANLKAGETLLVLGASGGVGIAAVQLGKALGARVIAAVSHRDKAEFTRRAGADEAIDYVAESLRDRVKALTEGRGVDVVYDPVGGDLAEPALRSLARQGRYLVVGFASGEIPAFRANIALLKEASIVGVWFGNWTANDPETARRNLDELEALAASGKLAPMISGTHRLDDFVSAFAAITERRVLGKVVLTMK